MEIGVPGGGTWPAYEELKRLLVKAGIPEKQVAFISDGNTDPRRDALMQKMRTGEIRVMIGPRQTMGTGVNVQHRLVGMHHVDPHWLPALIDQADGRGIRQGNLFYMEDSPEKVDGFSMDITHYVTKNSFDAYQWQAVARKGYMINQAMRGNLSLDKIEEIGGGQVFDAAEIAAIASNNPILLERATLERTIQNLQLVADAHERKQRDRRNDVARLPGASRLRQTFGACMKRSEAPCLRDSITTELPMRSSRRRRSFCTGTREGG
jgi:superfamily II DNA or RNA helicase